MADLQPIIIKRKKAGGHGGHHGGAWKVAYADFVTAMMCFFMVMWLMGSDEETKAAVADYFNNPTSAWRKDLTSKETAPLGDRTGAGENLLKGADGANPDDLIQRPVRPYAQPDTAGTKVSAILDSFMADDSIVSLDMVKFSIPESLLFRKGDTDQWAPGAQNLLDKIGRLTQKYKGTLQVQSLYEPGNLPSTSYEFQMSRAVSVSKYVVSSNWAREEYVTSSVLEKRRAPASEDARPEAPTSRKLEFTLTRLPQE